MKTHAGIMAVVLVALTSSSFAQSQTVTFQQGLNGYSGCADKELRDPDRNYGSGPKEDILLINEY